ncbi:MAG: hypothetical protein P1V97_01750 [Planctomycetota bacterium]|nr:hypothetical protein [Planctomycetota bacterium]
MAFKIDIDEAALEALYHRHSGNQEARFSVAMSVLGVLAPPLLLLSLILAVIGINNEDPEAWPPIEGRGHAMIGLALSIFGLLAWGLFLFHSLSD